MAETVSTAIQVADVVRAKVPQDPYWWSNGDHDRVFRSYRDRMEDLEAMGKEVSLDPGDLARAYSESLPLDCYGRSSVFVYLTGWTEDLDGINIHEGEEA